MATSTLEERALERKERLKALKRKRETHKDSDVVSAEAHQNLPQPKFRNYKPHHEVLQENVLEDAPPGNIKDEVKEQLESGKLAVIIDELDITNLAPRKPDWDLKRDVAKKLDKLERKTQKAIAELIRERLKQRQEYIADIINSEIGPKI